MYKTKLENLYMHNDVAMCNSTSMTQIALTESIKHIILGSYLFLVCSLLQN